MDSSELNKSVEKHAGKSYSYRAWPQTHNKKKKKENFKTFLSIAYSYTSRTLFLSIYHLAAVEEKGKQLSMQHLEEWKKLKEINKVWC